MKIISTSWLRLVGAASLFFVAATVMPLSVSAADQPKAVVELFTSQGCSSCPAADKVLATYAKSKDILALSFHVDYWNYLGWKDTFSKAQFTERQKRYAISFQNRKIYTPQAVVNGRDHVVGSRKNDVERLIKTFSETGKALTVPLITTNGDDNIQVTTNVASGNATLWLVYFNRSQDVKIERGENRGRTITYHNVVNDVEMMGMMKDGKLNVTLPLKEMKRKNADACALILQQTTEQGSPGAIIGATVVGDLNG